MVPYIKTLKLKFVLFLSLGLSLLTIISWFGFIVLQGRGPDDLITSLLTITLLPSLIIADVFSKNFVINAILMWIIVFFVQTIIFFSITLIIIFIKNFIKKQILKKQS